MSGIKYDYRPIFREVKGYFDSREFHRWQAKGGQAYQMQTGDMNFDDRPALEEFLRKFERNEQDFEPEEGIEQTTIFEFI